MRNSFIVTNCGDGMTKFRVVLIVDGKPIGNGLRFDSKADAKKCAEDILMKLTVGAESYYIEPAADLPPSISSAELIRRVASGKERA